MREIKDTIMELEALKNRKDEHEIKVVGAKEALSHAIKCCEIVAGLPSVEEIDKIIIDFSWALVHQIYVNRKFPKKEDILKLSQAIHKRIEGIK